jgi:chromosome segregation ATPase
MSDEERQELRHLADQRRREVALLKSRIARLEKEVRELRASSEFLVETITNLSKEIESVLSAFNAAHGAFRVLEFLGRIIKPLMLLSGIVGGIYTVWAKIRPGG